jgi:hypothetical protein
MIKANATNGSVAAEWELTPYLVRLIRHGAAYYQLETRHRGRIVTDTVRRDAGAAFRAFYAERDKRLTEWKLARAPKHSAPLFAPIQSELEL